MSTKNIALFLLGAGAVFFLTQGSMRRQRFIPGQTYYPPPPPRTAAHAWTSWATQMLQIYGNVRELWQPGGPFHNVPMEDIEAIQMDATGPVYA